MIALITLFLVGIGMAFFATQNLGTTAITIAGYSYADIPVYVVVLGSMLIGIVVSWILYLTNAVSSLVTLRGKNSEIKGALQTVDELKKENDTLRMENAKLQSRKESMLRDGQTTEPISSKIKHSLGINN